MAVIIDIGAEKDIHPKNKQDVGGRLAQLALVKNYGRENMEACGPLCRSHQIDRNQIRIEFDHVGKGLMVAEKGGPHFMDPVHPTPNDTLTEFSIQDAEGIGTGQKQRLMVTLSWLRVMQ